MDNSLTVHAVIREEREPESPYGNGNVLHTEIVSVHRHHASAMSALTAEREEIAKYLSSRFRAYVKTERVDSQLAESVPA